MHNRIDAVAGSAPGRLLPVDSIQSQRKAQDDHAGLERRQAPAVSFSSREEAGVNAYAPPAEVVARALKPDPVAPALAEALAAEPWGHPMPQKAMWEQAAAVRERRPEPEPVEAAVTIVASTPIATTPAAPATPAAVASAGSAAPVSPAWLTSLLKAR
jgi:hypothetical protein